jgi:hypothetical protein
MVIIWIPKNEDRTSGREKIGSSTFLDYCSTTQTGFEDAMLFYMN